MPAGVWKAEQKRIRLRGLARGVKRFYGDARGIKRRKTLGSNSKASVHTEGARLFISLRGKTESVTYEEKKSRSGKAEEAEKKKEENRSEDPNSIPIDFANLET